MQTVFYSFIRPAHGQSIADVIRKAQNMGYSMMPFNGWDNDDLGYSGAPGPRRAEAAANGKILREIQDACVVYHPDGYDFPHIIQTATSPSAEESKFFAEYVRG